MAVGENVMLILHVRPAAIATLHVPRVAENAAPVVVTPVTVSGWAPVFVTVSVFVVDVFCLVAPNAKLVGIDAVVATTPVPLRLTLPGDPAALWAIETLAVLAPAVVGVNLTLIAQEPAGAMLAQ